MLRRLRRGLCPQIQPGKILPRLRRTHEENQSHRAKAETKAEMSRFRPFQTRINQGFFRGCQRVCDTFGTQLSKICHKKCVSSYANLV